MSDKPVWPRGKPIPSFESYADEVKFWHSYDFDDGGEGWEEVPKACPCPQCRKPVDIGPTPPDQCRHCMMLATEAASDDLLIYCFGHEGQYHEFGDSDWSGETAKRWAKANKVLRRAWEPPSAGAAHGLGFAPGEHEEAVEDYEFDVRFNANLTDSLAVLLRRVLKDGEARDRAEIVKIIEEHREKWRTMYEQDTTAQIVIGELGRVIMRIR